MALSIYCTTLEVPIRKRGYYSDLLGNSKAYKRSNRDYDHCGQLLGGSHHKSYQGSKNGHLLSTIAMATCNPNSPPQHGTVLRLTGLYILRLPWY
jgi:hypothetical protein